MDLDLSPLLKLHFVAVFVDQFVGNAEFTIKVVRTFYRNLRFFGLSGAGNRLNNLLDDTREFGTPFLSMAILRWHGLLLAIIVCAAPEKPDFIFGGYPLLHGNSPKAIRRTP